MKHRIGRISSTVIVLTLSALQSIAQSIYEPYTFTTIAGCSGYGSADGTGSTARFRRPSGVAADSVGNVYVADSANHTIRKITPVGEVTTLAGLAGSWGSTDGTGSDARFNEPQGVAVDNAGNVYVADTGNNTIRRVAPVGTNWVVITLAGSVTYDAHGNYVWSSGSEDGIGSDARFYNPSGVAVDTAGNVYVADTSNGAVRKVTRIGMNWMVTTLAQLKGTVTSLALDSGGNVYVSISGTIWKVTPAGVVTTLSGLFRSADGVEGDVPFNDPQGVSVDSAGNLYVADSGDSAIRKVTPVGTNWLVATLAGFAATQGNADGTGRDAQFRYPSAIAVNSAGNVYVADTGNSTIRKVTPVGTNWVVSTLAGLAGGSGGTDGLGVTSQFSQPSAVALDSVGNVYVADTRNNTIRKIAPVGTNWLVTTLAGKVPYYDAVGDYITSDGSTDGIGNDALFSNPTGVAVDNAGNVYVADSGNGTIRKVTPAGVVTTVAGLAGSFGSADGLGSEARFSGVAAHIQMGVAVDNAGNVYVADSYNGTIRKMTPVGTNWLVTTLAGLARRFGNADGTGGDAQFGGIDQYGGILGVAVDSLGNLYVSDYWNLSVRKITPRGVVTTLCNLDATPTCVAVDSVGNVYVAIVDDMVASPTLASDPPSAAIQKMSPDGTVTTLAGVDRLSRVAAFGSKDGTGSDARFNDPYGLAVDSAGNVYVADTGNNTIRIGFPTLAITSSGPSFGFTGGHFGFNLTGPAGKVVVVEGSTNLMSWQPLWTNAFAGSLSFSDSQSRVSSNRFYRAYSK